MGAHGRVVGDFVRAGTRRFCGAAWDNGLVCSVATGQPPLSDRQRPSGFLRQPSKLLMLFLPPPVRAAGVQPPKLRWCPSAVLPFHRPRFSLLPSRLQLHMIRGRRGL